MTTHASKMAPVELGWAVAWPAFWTGFPIKLVLSLLLLAADLPPWEFPGLAFLLLLSLPIDLWAVSVSSRTVFLEKLALQPPASLGMTLWWQGMALLAVYGSLACWLEQVSVTGAKAIAAKIMGLGVIKDWPVAEKISIELVLWGSVATIVLAVLVLGGLFLFGKIVQRQAKLASPAAESYDARVRQWDLMRVPADQPLMLTAFTVTGVLLVFLLWAFMPATTRHPHESYKKDEKKPDLHLRPADALQKVEKSLTQAEATVQALEQKSKGEAKKNKSKATEKKAPAKKV